MPLTTRGVPPNPLSRRIVLSGSLDTNTAPELEQYGDSCCTPPRTRAKATT